MAVIRAPNLAQAREAARATMDEHRVGCVHEEPRLVRLQLASYVPAGQTKRNATMYGLCVQVRVSTRTTVSVDGLRALVMHCGNMRAL